VTTNISSTTTRYEIQESEEAYILAKGDTVNVDGDYAIFASEFITNDELIIKGKVVQSGDGYAAIRTDAVNMSIDIAKGGSVVGTAGIYSENFDPSTRLEINVDGLLDAGKGFAIETADSKDHVVNHGTIKGKIYLGSGEDIFDNRGGTLFGKVEGGAGDDTLIVDSAKTKLFENGGSEGYDTVKSTVSYTLSENVERLILMGKGDLSGKGNNDESDLFGNAGDNKLFGLGGGDILDGGKGNDTLDGGEGADTFVFKSGYGRDTILDFEDGMDTIDVSKWNDVDDFADLKSHMDLSGGDVLITFGKDVLRLANTSEGDFDANDFIF